MARPFPSYQHIENTAYTVLELLETAYELTRNDAARDSITQAADKIIADENNPA